MEMKNSNAMIGAIMGDLVGSRFEWANEKTKDLIYYAGLLQNIGKITLPESLFTNKGKLSKEEWEKLQNHPNVGVNLLMNINFLSEVIPYIHYHKERWDGGGEPEGLKGNSIPFGSRIIAVADAYTAMTSDRSYRDAMAEEDWDGWKMLTGVLGKKVQLVGDDLFVRTLAEQFPGCRIRISGDVFGASVVLVGECTHYTAERYNLPPFEPLEQRNLPKEKPFEVMLIEKL